MTQGKIKFFSRPRRGRPSAVSYQCCQQRGCAGFLRPGYRGKPHPAGPAERSLLGIDMTTSAPSSLIDRMRTLVGADGVLTAPSEMLVYECDGYTVEKSRPDIVVFPSSTEQVAAVVRACNELDVPFL